MLRLVAATLCLAALLVLVTMLLSGCLMPLGSQTPNDQLAFATQAYSEVVTSLAMLRAQGALTEAQASQVDALILEGRALLDAWRDVIRATPPGQAPDTLLVMQQFQQILIEMAATRQEALRQETR
jgi:hypothetical protein